ncbi:hypothetical protein CONPUDRAFT_97040 [Coniophora puteana RWD-64-598 SS2]|uniref:protein-tyrosine-phosphatase n=1 Tax=Coniophora puteana (strain RWD-64-598) TaxID=741705 RepID=A0A5M3N1D0_CONPW|nr:uncharacterized protein CONPUDRAFT_97040 [Coniophora puteana RWD-64-598 SS2]EIW84705.1 hypothetical protein CONPUDRAFT_97040 [Coniophora puteana RWD-64-598 SS2]
MDADEVIPGLWIGGLESLKDIEGLRKRNVRSVVSAMRGKVTINATLNNHQISIDDTVDEDILVHFLPSISFIQTELDKGHGVLVHCQAGVSRSATIVAAYLMHSQKIEAEAALEMIRQARPQVEPNEGFYEQLLVFQQASYKFTGRDKTIRMFYMLRTTEQILNGDGTLPDSVSMFAKHPRSPSDSIPNSPMIVPHRRIRCKMCRTELATREHMLDHGQLGPPTPAGPSLTPAASRRPSMTEPSLSRRPSSGANQLPALSELTPLSPSSRRPSGAGTGPGADLQLLMSLNRRPSVGSTSFSISRRPSGSRPARSGSKSENSGSPNGAGAGAGSNGGGLARPQLAGGRSLLESMSMSALEDEDDDMDVEEASARSNSSGATTVAGMTTLSISRRPSQGAKRPSFVSMEGIGREISDTLDAATTPAVEDENKSLDSTGAAEKKTAQPADAALPVASPAPISSTSASPGYATPSDLAAQLHTHPKLAALRQPAGLSMTSIQGPSSPRVIASPPILMNSKCSGYFVEPMKWMEPTIESGAIAGKIVCPNKKCGAKLGNFDWAGVCCSCREWVTPGFCIHRSKVDEIIG